MFIPRLFSLCRGHEFLLPNFGLLVFVLPFKLNWISPQLYISGLFISSDAYLFFFFLFLNILTPSTATKWLHFSFFHCGLDKVIDDLSHYLRASTVGTSCSPDYCPPLKISSPDTIPQESFCVILLQRSRFKSKPDSGEPTAELLCHPILCSLFYADCALLVLTKSLLLM